MLFDTYLELIKLANQLVLLVPEFLELHIKNGVGDMQFAELVVIVELLGLRLDGVVGDLGE